MSQLKNTTPPCLSDADNPNWEELLDNVTTFISTSRSLLQSLKRTITWLDEDDGEESITTLTKSKAEGVPIEKKEVEGIAYEDFSAGLKMKDSGGVARTSSKNLEETPSEVRKDESVCICPKSSKKNNKKLAEIYNKEKTERLNKLREELVVSKRNIVSIQKQMFDLEKECNLGAYNTVKAKVNPAALYKEIMKPQSLPAVKSGKYYSRTYYRKTHVTYEDQKKIPGKWSVLSTIPPEESYYQQ